MVSLAPQDHLEILEIQVRKVPLEVPDYRVLWDLQVLLVQMEPAASREHQELQVLQERQDNQDLTVLLDQQVQLVLLEIPAQWVIPDRRASPGMLGSRVLRDHRVVRDWLEDLEARDRRDRVE